MAGGDDTRTQASRFRRSVARGRSEATPLRLLVVVGSVISAVVIVVVLVVYAIQSAV